MDRRLADARFTIAGPSPTGGFVNALPMLRHRYFPSIERGAELYRQVSALQNQGATATFPSIERGAGSSLNELVTMKGYQVEASPVWGSHTELEFHDSPVAELTRIAPEEMIGGYYRSVGMSWDGGTLLDPGR